MKLPVPNIGTLERYARFALGAGFLAWGLLTANWWGAAGLVLLLTASVRWCPLYRLLGWRRSP